MEITLVIVTAVCLATIISFSAMLRATHQRVGELEDENALLEKELDKLAAEAAALRRENAALRSRLSRILDVAEGQDEPAG